jgi:phenylalanyl-tRNA synthetase alpha chain
MLDRIHNYLNEVAAFTPANKADLETFRIKFIGKKGLVNDILAQFKEVPNDQKKAFGQKINELKQAIEAKISEAQAAFESQADETGPNIDLTLPPNVGFTGSRHPISLIKNQIIQIFERLGFAISEGPELVTDWENFGALNFEENHPARDMQDTFFVQTNPDVLLRTHTSSVQVAEMQKGLLPIRTISPGRVYRNETISARAHCFFHQIEGLYIAENVSFADLKQVLMRFAQEMFGPETKIRLRPSYFPFTEPSAEMDISCLICGGKGCTVCKHSGWVEILGCGMVDPNVLKNCGIDPNKYSGFAFGMGVERIAMLKYGIKDLRLFSENDQRFLEQFSTAY